MNIFPAVIAATLLAAAAPQARALLPDPAIHEVAPRSAPGDLGAVRNEPRPFSDFRDSYRPEPGNQVHIQERLVIRISPAAPPSVREDTPPRRPRGDRPTRFKEKKIGGCVALEDIAGAQPSDENRLLLFMRDHRILSAALERACDADDFYLGFYVERNADGMLCSKRDRLHARTGATCRVDRLSRLVAIKD
jgi:hypothetical protein